MSYSRPGVYVNEAPLKATVTNRPGRTTASFVGEASRGPVGKPVLVSSWNSFVSVFGDIVSTYELGYAIYQYFSNGGVECYVNRVLTSSTTVNTDSTLALTHDSGNKDLFTATSKLAGVDGDNITLDVIKSDSNPDTGTAAGGGIIDLTVKYKGVTKETFVGLTFSDTTSSTSATAAVNDAVSGSQYITVSAQVTTTAVNGTAISTAFTSTVAYTLASGATAGQAENAVGYVRGNSTGTSANFFLLTAENAGEWANGLTVEVSAGIETPTASSYGTFNMLVKLNGAEKERWSEVSIDPEHNRYVETLIDTYSDYLTVSSVASPTKATNTSVSAGTYTLVGGGNGTAVAAADYDAALTYFDQVTGDLIINLPGVSGASEVNYALAYAAARGTGFIVIDPNSSDTTASAAITRIAGYSNSGYGAVYYPAATTADPTKTGPAALRTSPLGGAIVAAYGRAERMHSVAKAPAGFSLDLANVYGLVGTYTEADEGTLYDASINPIRLVPGTGAIINGARTLAKTSPDKFIPIRRTLNYVKARLKTITAFAAFEPNDGNLRQSVTTVVENELRKLWAQGGLKGNTAAQAFFVTCNTTNNSSSTVAQGELHVEVGLALQYPTEFVIINVSQWTGGSNAAETL